MRENRIIKIIYRLHCRKIKIGIDGYWIIRKEEYERK